MVGRYHFPPLKHWERSRAPAALTDVQSQGLGQREAQGEIGKKKLLLKGPEIKKEKPFSGKEPELVAGKAPVEGGAGSKLGCSEPAVGKGLGIHQMHFIAHSGPWDEAKTPNSAPLLGFNLCFLNCKWSSTSVSMSEEHQEPRVGA